MFDAVVLATAPTANDKLLGITLAERGRRVADKAGARRVYMIDSEAALAGLAAWDRDRGDAALLFVRAGDQLVHLPLVRPLIAGLDPRRIAVGPTGEYAGALWADAAHGREIIAALTLSVESAEQNLVAGWQSAERIRHDDIAVHRATTPQEKRGAERMLLQLLVKASEDSPVSKYVYRPLSRPLTRLLLHTSITPNQVSYFVGVLGLAGCVLTAFPSYAALVWGAVLVFWSCVIDGCDGEIARMKLQFSPFGAWLDTVIDELTQVSYFFAIGYHTYQHHPSWWLGGSIALGGISYAATIYAIYYFSLVVIKKGGSQYYEGDLEIVDDGGMPALRKRVKVSTAPAWAKALGQIFLYMIRRDFINLAAMIVAFFDGYVVIYAGIWLGTIVAGAIIVPEHVRLRRQLAEIKRRGGVPRYVAA
ncbi:MAG TPA: CDP-alcohol phosphatidyltransferase family protein [Kofleriaceae bacterium]|nr:CDP-alcohol phosphatidyltransferase family protein [Kofleriaceae bacterium]